MGLQPGGCWVEAMRQSQSIYDSTRLAAKYAFDRPPVHPHLIRVMAKHILLNGRAGRALDVGCGAGLSTAALGPLAEITVGIEPEQVMLAHSHAVAPHALFLVSQAERLPFRAGVFDLITAAGSVNYADLGCFLPEAARVLTPCGVLVIYDFSAGRRLRGSDRLEEWYLAFERRYPSPPGYALDVKGLPYGRSGLRLDRYEELGVAVQMNLDSYLAYIMSESGVESAIVQGMSEREVRDWCEDTLSAVFGNESREVLFDSYIAYVRSDGKK
jgi:SAM-dependent methyltransferase